MTLDELRNTREPLLIGVCHCGHIEQRHGLKVATAEGFPPFSRTTACLQCDGFTCDEYELQTVLPLDDFVGLAVEAEREACAQIAQGAIQYSLAGERIAKLIRARSQATGNDPDNPKAGK